MFVFFRKFDVLCFLVTSVLRFAFFLYYRRYFTDSRERIYLSVKFENFKINAPLVKKPVKWFVPLRFSVLLLTLKTF